MKDAGDRLREGAVCMAAVFLYRLCHRVLKANCKRHVFLAQKVQTDTKGKQSESLLSFTKTQQDWHVWCVNKQMLLSLFFFPSNNSWSSSFLRAFCSSYYMKGKCFQVCVNVVSTETTSKLWGWSTCAPTKKDHLMGTKSKVFFSNECDISSGLNIFKITNSHVETAAGELEFFASLWWRLPSSFPPGSTSTFSNVTSFHREW